MTNADVQTLLEFFDERPARRRKFRRRDSIRARTNARRPGLPAARPSRSAPRRRQASLSPERSRSRLAPVVLPVEQHSRRAPARPGRARTADEAADPRTASAAHAGRSARHRCARRRLRRAVAESAPRRRSGGRSGFAIPTSTTACCEAFKRETELFVASTLREDRSVAGSLRANYTFVNERLARHYGIPGIYGSRFRRVTLPNPDQRGGLLAHGALLATTSYPDRTSPVLRGKWLLNNIFGLPVPPPPPGVDTNLPETKPGAVPPIDPRAAGAAPAESRRAPAVIRSSIRWGSRWRISTPSAGGGPSTNRASRSTRAAPR